LNGAKFLATLQSMRARINQRYEIVSFVLAMPERKEI
jgi:hypothetical protein